VSNSNEHVPSSPDSKGSGFTRRRLLGTAAATAGLATAMTALPPNVRKAMAAPAPTHGGLGDIKHLVFLMQENRSFDHYFGTLSGVRGFSDPRALRLPNGQPVFYQPDPSNPDGYLLPYHLDTKTTSAQAIPSTSHAWSVQHQAWNNGAMDNWLPAHLAADGPTVGPFTMGYYTRADIPFHYALADAFTVCDNYFCSVLGPTYPNRYMWMTGTIDPNAEFGGPALENDPNGWRYYRWQTPQEVLQEAGVSWKVYVANDGGQGYNVLGNMQQYNQAPHTSPLYQNGTALTPVGQFEYDAQNDQLPTVSWLMTNNSGNEHPASMPAGGAALIASKIDAIASNPDVWAKTAFIVNWDENDGLFDHVAPLTPPPGTPDEFVTATSPAGTPGDGLPVGSGFRVPCIIVSPWTQGGYVCNEPFDHTSTLRLIEQVTGVSLPNISAFRRQTFGDLTSAFRFSHADQRPPSLPDTNGPLNLATYETSQFKLPAFPGSNQVMPAQEPGARRHVP